MDVRTLTAPGRRRPVVALGVVAALVVVLLALIAVQVRAQDAQETRDRAAAAATEEAERERAERERRAAEAEQRRVEEVRAEAWAAAVVEAETEHGGATALLADTEGAVADDAPRVALAAALDALRGLLDGGTAPDDQAVEGLRVHTAEVRRAAQAVTESHAAWVQARAEEERVAAEAKAAADAVAAERAAADRAARAPGAVPTSGDPGAGPRPPTSGAGPDCGSTATREPPSQPVAFMTSTPSETGDGSNGRVPRSRMAALPWCVDAEGNAQWLRADAAAAMIRLNEAFRARFGENIAIDMAYRSYEQQVAMREYYGSVAARPGTSNHGWGTAIDTWEWRAYAFGSERYEWLVANGPSYGWVAPAWARHDGSNPEYWHFEYVG